MTSAELVLGLWQALSEVRTALWALAAAIAFHAATLLLQVAVRKRPPTTKRHALARRRSSR